jgi:four helix bundle protein
MSEGPENQDTGYVYDEGKPYDLEERTYRFAKDVRGYVKVLPNSISHQEDIRQLVRASGSVAANFIEAVEALGGKDKLYKFKTSRKEAKESRLWLRLLSVEGENHLEPVRDSLVNEASELMKILGAIVRKYE